MDSEAHKMKCRSQVRDIDSAKAGHTLMSVRMLCQLRHQDVARDTRHIAKLLGHDFKISMYRLAGIESGRVIPSVPRLSSLCAVYGLEMRQVMQWYGIQSLVGPTGSAEAA
jgi:hypothetical protein